MAPDWIKYLLAHGIAGGAPDEGGEDGDGDGGKDGGEDAGDQGKQGQGDGDEGKTAEDYRRELRESDKVRKREAEKSRKRIAALEAQVREREDADKSEQEKALEAAREEAGKQAREEAQAELRQERLRAATARLAAGKFANVDNAIKLLDLDDDEVFDEDGKVQADAVSKALDGLLEAQPHLKATPSQPTGSGGGGQGEASDASMEEKSTDQWLKEMQGANK